MSCFKRQRLEIRRWNLDADLDDALAIYGDAQTMRFIPCDALDRDQTTRVDRTNDASANNKTDLVFGRFCSRKKRGSSARAALRIFPGHAQDVEIAWLFNKAYHGNGYATEAAKAVMQYAFEDLQLPLLYALIDRENAASIAVANRLGMEYDRIIRAYKRELMRYRKRR